MNSTVPENLLVDADTFIGDLSESKEAGKILGHSVLEAFHTCPRRYAIDASAIVTKNTSESSIDLIFGSTVHTGIQALWEGDHFDIVVLKMLKEWKISLFAEKPRGNKSFWSAVKAVLHYKSNFYEPLRDRGFRAKGIECHGIIELPKDYVYGLSVDLFLYSEMEDEYLLQEIKTASAYIHPAQYGNSKQTIGYTAYLATAYDIPLQNCTTEYVIYVAPTETYHTLPIVVSREDCANFILDVFSDLEVLEFYKSTGHFPMRGGSCLPKYRIPCPHYGSCNTFYTTSITKKVPFKIDDTKVVNWRDVLNKFGVEHAGTYQG